MESYFSQRSRKPAWRRGAHRPESVVVPRRLRYRQAEFEVESEDSGEESDDELVPTGTARNVPVANPVGFVPGTNLNLQAEETDSEPDTPVATIPPVAAIPPPPPPVVTLTPIAPSLQTRSTTSIGAAPTPTTFSEPAPPSTIAEQVLVTVVSTTSLTSTTTTSLDSPSPTRSTFVSFMTSSLPPLPTMEPSAPRKGLGPQLETITATLESAVLPTETVSGSPGETSGISDNGRDRSESERSRDDDYNGNRIDSATQHVLIGVGSIGAFIFACFLGWVVWRATRKSRRPRDSLPSSREDFSSVGSNSGGFASKIPFLRNLVSGRGWQNLGNERPNELPPTYEKARGQSLRLDTGYFAADSKTFGNYPNMQPGGLYFSPTNISPTGSMVMRTNAMDGSGLAYNRTQSRAPSVSLSSIVDNYTNGTDPDSTLRSGVATQGTFYNQSELARQPSNAYDPARRQVSRASELSSISSGFGDGDIIVPGMPQQPMPASQAMRSAQNGVGRASWMSKGRRDTVYTEHSEDQPPRFRTVSSWVNQQTGRVNRAQERADSGASDIPPVPGLPGTGRNGMPPEQEFTMMMPDGEVPRRADDMGTR